MLRKLADRNPRLCPTTLSQMRMERLEQTSRFLEQQQLDVLVAISSGSRGQRGNVRWLSNYATSSGSSVFLCSRKGPPRLLVSYPVHRFWAQDTSWLDDIQVTSDYPSSIACYLEHQHFDTGRVGWVGPPILLEALQEGFARLSLPFESCRVQAEFVAVRSIRLPSETELVERCAAIGDDVLRQVANRVRPDVTERELVADAEYVARRLGAEGLSVLVATGPGMARPQPSDRPLQRGDVIQFSVEPEGPAGLWVQTVRMFAVGAISTATARLMETGLLAEACGAASLRSGTTANDTATRMLEQLQVSEEELASPLGHGIGFDNSEPPRISRTSSEVLQTGMDIVLHPDIITSEAAMFLGNTYHVRNEGSTRLSDLAADFGLT